MNGHYGIVNNDSGLSPKSFKFNRNPCSRSPEMAVHDPAKSLFTFHRNLRSRSPEIPIVRYQQEQYPGWLSRCETFLRELHHQLQNGQAVPKIGVDLLNEGSRPAEDVRVVFSLRGGDLLLKLPPECDEPESFDVDGGMSVTIETGNPRIELPRPPAAPVGHWKRRSTRDLMGAIERAARLSAVVQPLSPLRVISALHTPHKPDAFYWKMGSRPAHPRPATELNCEQWRHRAEPEPFEFEIVSPLDLEHREGALHVEIHASNLTDPVKEVIPIRVSVQEGDTLEEAGALVELLHLSNRIPRLAR